jgi:predicted RNase H-like HicB family nuclease
MSMVYEIPLEIERLEEGQYLASSPLLPGLHVMGESREAVISLAPGVARALLDVMHEKGLPIPAGLRPAEEPYHAVVLVQAAA